MAVIAILLVPGSAATQGIQTIRPGMSTDEVKGVFGEPAAIRSYGEYTYFFYQNGVEPEYGTADIVFFEGNQVVDAVLRSSWREYAGESSSPKGTVASPTPGGMYLEVPGQVEAVEVRTAQPRETQPRAAQPPPLPLAVTGGSEFSAFIPVCVKSFVDNQMLTAEASLKVCECTSNEAQAAGVEATTIASITETLKTDASALSMDPRVQAAGSTCVDAFSGGAVADTTSTGG
jgi:hypothetical protein